MRFSILKPILSWRAWQKPRYRRSIRSRHQKRKSRPLLPKSSSRKAKRTRRLMKRQPYRNPGKVKEIAIDVLAQVSLTGLSLWMVYEIVMSWMLVE